MQKILLNGQTWLIFWAEIDKQEENIEQIDQ